MCTYLYSPSLSKYYVGSVGSTVRVEIRMNQHNKGKSSFTKKGIPWNLIHTIECDSRPSAVPLEMKIKKRGIQRYLDDFNLLHS